MKRRGFLQNLFGAALAAPALVKAAEIERKPVEIAEPEHVEPTRQYESRMWDCTAPLHSGSVRPFSHWTDDESDD